MTRRSEPLDASVGVSQWQAVASVDEFVATAGNAGRIANLSGGGDVVTASDVAAGVGRDAAGVAG